MRYFVVHLHKLLQPGVTVDAIAVKPAGRKAAPQKRALPAKKARKGGAKK
jgi:hypothetical protein